MNLKYEAIDKLKNYEVKKNAISAIPEEIKRLEMAASAIRSATWDGTPVQGGGSGREDMLLSNIVQREEVKRSLQDAVLWVNIVDKAMAVLAEEERLVLDRFYIHPAKGNVERLCGELGCEKTSAYRKRDAALRRFTIAVYGCTEI